MIKGLFFFVSYFICLSVLLAQKNFFEGQVMDSDNGTEISDVHIFDSQGHLKAVSDLFGDFYLPILSSDTLSASCIGYKTKTFTISQLMRDSVIQLARDTLRLNEIIIEPLTASQIIALCIDAIDDLYLQNDIHTCGLFNYQVKRQDSTIFSLTNSGLNIEMARPHFYPMMKNLKISSLENHADFITKGIFNNLSNEVENIFLFDHIIRKRGFLNPENSEMWRFDIIGYTSIDQINLVVIQADFIDHKKRMNHSAKIYVNEKDFGVLKVDYQYQWDKNEYVKTHIDSLWISEKTWKGRANYLKIDQHYVLSNLDYSSKKKVANKDLMNNYKPLFDYEIISQYTANDIRTGF